MLQRSRINGRESDQIFLILNSPFSTIGLTDISRIFFLRLIVLSLIFIEIDLELLENILILMYVGRLPTGKLFFGLVVIEGGVGIQPHVSIFHGNFNIKNYKR